MKTLLNIYKFALKSAWVYKINFIFSSIAVIINDSLFFVLYILYLNYFNKSWLNLSDFLLAWWIFTFWFWILVWLLNNLVNLWEIIENGKLDWYLSYPIHPLKLISLNKIDPGSAWDILFAIWAFILYFNLVWFSFITFVKVIFVCLIGSFFIIWFAILVWSISFFVQRASLWTDYIFYIYWAIGSYPYKVFLKNTIIVVLAVIVGIYHSWILWQLIIFDKGFSYKELLFFILSIWLFILSMYIFNKWLKRYTSWNLVNNNV